MTKRPKRRAPATIISAAPASTTAALLAVLVLPAPQQLCAMAKRESLQREPQQVSSLRLVERVVMRGSLLGL